MAQGDDPRSQDLVPHAEYGAPARYDPEDEISLFDLWDVLIRRSRWIGGVLLVTLLLGLAHALSRESVYEYSHAVEVGQRMVADDLLAIESPRSVSAKLQQNYVPVAIRAWLADHPDAEWQPRVDVSVPADAQIVVLKAKGAVEREGPYGRIMSKAANRLVQDHERIIETVRQQLAVNMKRAVSGVNKLEAELESIRNRYELQIEKARNKLRKLEDQRQVTKDEFKRIDRRESLLREDVEELKADLEAAETNRQAANRDPGTPAAAMGLLMLSNEIRETRQRLSQLRVRLDVDLPNQRDNIQSRIADLERQIGTQSGEIALLERERDDKLAAKKDEIEVQRAQVQTVQTRIDNLSRTQPLSEPQQSVGPVGTGNTVVMALSLVLGGMLGVFVAFFVEFVQAANRRRREREGAADSTAGSDE